MKSSPSVAPKLRLLATSLAIAISLFECGLRIQRFGGISIPVTRTLRTIDYSRGWALEPSGRSIRTEADYTVVVETNSKGLRDREHSYAKPEGVFRIVIIGDSFMEAYQVPAAESLPDMLEERLRDRRVEVINLGVGGYGTAQEYIYLKEEGLKYHPDLVLMALYANDVRNNSVDIETLFWKDSGHQKLHGRPYAIVHNLEEEITWIHPNKAALDRVAKKWRRKRRIAVWNPFGRLYPTLVDEVVTRGIAGLLERASFDSSTTLDLAIGGWMLEEPNHEELWDAAWLTTQRLILEINKLSDDSDSKFALLYVPSAIQVESWAAEAIELDIRTPNSTCAS